MKMLYKYYAPTDYNLDAIERQYFYFRHSSKLNDPFDMNFPELVSPKDFLEKISNMEILKTIMRKYASCSFSERPDNLRLWSLYADSHKGFAVEYDPATFHKLHDLGKGIRYPFHKVHYVDGAIDYKKGQGTFTLTDYDGQEQTFKIQDCLRDDPKIRDSFILYLANIKGSKWAYEEEWRLFVDRDLFDFDKPGFPLKDGLTGVQEDEEKNGYKVDMPEGAMRSIILGCNIEEKLESILKTIAKMFKIPIYKMKLGKAFTLIQE